MNKLCTFLFLTVLISRDLNQSLQIAGDNSLEIKKAMSSASLNHSKGMQWLITHMPTEDLKKVKAEFPALAQRISIIFTASSKGHCPNILVMYFIVPPYLICYSQYNSNTSTNICNFLQKIIKVML